ncbi:MAG: DUF2185 domain-containing protein [Gammaproteobacteria bacterium]|nr:DUF2185 domain-containing protein [Gammaproteobacteria bacterium]
MAGSRPWAVRIENDCCCSRADSGWRFFTGEETQEYIDDLNNTGIYEVNTIANYDPDIIPYLDAPPGSKFGRIGGKFVHE